MGCCGSHIVVSVIHPVTFPEVQIQRANGNSDENVPQELNPDAAQAMEVQENALEKRIPDLIEEEDLPWEKLPQKFTQACKDKEKPRSQSL